MGINKDQVEGRVKEAAGKTEEATGKVVGNKSMQTKGIARKLAGTVQATYGDAKEDVKKDTK